MRWVSWRYGRNFGAWHKLTGKTLCACGARIPERALVNFADVPPIADRCLVCGTQDTTKPTLKLEKAA